MNGNFGVETVSHEIAPSPAGRWRCRRRGQLS